MVLTISARDGGGLSSLVNAVVTIRILQTAVAPAVFERSRYTFSVPEDISEGSAVGTVKVREPLSKWTWNALRQTALSPYRYKYWQPILLEYYFSRPKSLVPGFDCCK